MQRQFNGVTGGESAMSGRARPKLPEADRIMIKADTAAAIDAVNGLKVAAHITGLSEKQLSRCSRANYPDLIPAEAAVLIDRVAGWPLIARGLYDLARRDIVAGDAFGAGDVALLARESGEAIAEAAAALADSSISVAEAARITRELDQLARAVAILRQKLALARVRK